jgi:hypothetical protein
VRPGWVPSGCGEPKTAAQSATWSVSEGNDLPRPVRALTALDQAHGLGSACRGGWQAELVTHRTDSFLYRLVGGCQDLLVMG